MKTFSYVCWAGAMAWVGCKMVFAAAPANDNFADRTPLSGTTVNFAANPFESTVEPNDPAVGPNAFVGWSERQNAGTQWWTWTSPVSGYAALSVATADKLTYDSAIEIYPGDSLESLSLTNRIVDMGVDVGLSIGFAVNAGQQYAIEFVGNALTNISYKFHLEASATPVIARQPQSQTVGSGASAYFSVFAPTFGTNGNVQWQHNGVNIPGATHPTFQINNATTADAGEYRAIVTVKNAGAQTISLPATLTVTGAEIRPELRLAAAPGSNTFAVRVMGETEQSYLVQYSTNFAFNGKLLNQSTPTPVEYVPEGVETRFQATGQQAVFFRAMRDGDVRSMCLANLRRLEFAKELWQQFRNLPPGTATDINDVDRIAFDGKELQCPLAGEITYNAVGTAPSCSIHGF